MKPEIYEKYKHLFTSQLMMGPNTVRLLDEMVTRYPLENRARMMDLGCGTGILCEILHSRGIRAAGMDFSSGMIEIARRGSDRICYEVADMITYRPEKQFDLVTCTGDAVNHIPELSDVEKIFQNVYAYTASGGYFIFDILNENERE